MRRDPIKQTETIKLSKKNIFQQNEIVEDKYKMIDVSLYPQSDDIYNNFVEDIYGEDTTILVSNNKI
jgi:hypothetical protein